MSASRPSLSAVVACAAGAVVSMAAGVYFGGHDQLPLAMIGTTLFVAFGGVAFELARRRSH
jgi:hypothetical protein